jgi:hypothetical protein
MKQNKNIRAIKACGRLDNMKSWPFIPKDRPSINKFPRWFKETKKTSIPLARSVDKRLTSVMKEAYLNARNYYSKIRRKDI